jgi:cytochrome c
VLDGARAHFGSEISRAGVAELLGMNPQRQAELSARNSWITLERAYQDSLDGFKITLGLPMEADIEPDAGSVTYATRCASCHGLSGEGGIRTRMLGSNPYARVVTKSFGAPGAAWANDPALFERLVLQGSTGYVMPASGDLSKSDVRDVFTHVLMLRARQETAGRAGS